MAKFSSLYAIATVFTSIALALQLSPSSFSEAPPREGAKEDNRTYSQGTRGCPIRLGQLALLELSGGEGVYYLESGNINPLMAFVIEGEQPERLSISVGEIDDALNYKSVWEQESIISNREKQFLALPPLEVGRDYRVTFQVLCPQRWGYGRSLSVWVKRVGDAQTDYDRKLEEMWMEKQLNLDVGLSGF